MNDKVTGKKLFELVPLKWLKSRNGTRAEPQGLRWKYYIEPVGQGVHKLYLVDTADQYNKEMSKLYSTFEEAQAKATEHYLSVLGSLVTIIK